MVNKNNKDAFDRDALIALYHETWSEIHRLRNYEWRIAYYFIILSGGLIALLISNSLQSFLSVLVRWLLTIVQVIGTIFGIYQLELTHGYLTQQRNIRRRIEELLGFYDPGKFSEEPILPVDWKGKRLTKSFQRRDLIIPIIIMFMLFQIASIYIIWKVP